MNILYFTHPLNGLLMIGIPIALGAYIAHKFGLGWRLWWIGAGAFVLSQVGHIPFNAALTVLFERGIFPSPPETWRLAFNAIFLGLSAGLWEEVFRYIAYRWWAKDARTWPKGLMLGAGHGGIEAIILGLLVLVTVINMIVMKTADLELLFGALPPESLQLAKEQLAMYWSLPWYDSLLGALERLFAIAYHLSASILVLQVFLRKQIRWLFLAVGWHMMLDAIAVFAIGTWNIYITETIIGVFALASLGIVFAFRGAPESNPEPSENAIFMPHQQEPATLTLGDIPVTMENLEQTRYT